MPPSFWGTACLFVCLVVILSRWSVCLHVCLPPMASRLLAHLLCTSPSDFYLCVPPDLQPVCLAVLVCASEYWGLQIPRFYLVLPVYLPVHLHKPTDSLTQLISSSHAHSSGRMWPCLIVYHAHLFSLHDVTIAYLFSPGLPSHIKMIDSFHSLHIFKLYLISSFLLAFKSLLSRCLKVLMLPRHIAVHNRVCFFS